MLSILSAMILIQYPLTFDLRDVNGENYVSSVKYQQGGTCWAHGTIASMESNLLLSGVWQEEGEAGEPDLAEYHMDWWNGFNSSWNPDLEPPYNGLLIHEGGDYLISSAYMTRGDGAVRDIDGQSFTTPPDFNSTVYHHYIPQTISWITAGASLQSLDSVKDALMTNGAVATCISYSTDFMGDDFIHYQPAYSTELPTHAVAIIGWNDTLQTQASEPGAWLCKNSWGADWGLDGFFWASYWDKWICRDYFMGAVSFSDVQLEPFNTSLYHDFHGWRDTFDQLESAMNAFSAGEKCVIEKVSFFTAEDSITYVFELYSSMASGTPSGMILSQTGEVGRRGLHTAELDQAVPLSAGDSIYAVLNLSSGGHPYDRTAEVSVLLGAAMDVIVGSSASQGESWYCQSGIWKDLWYWSGNPYPGTGNFCIKLLGFWTGLHVFPQHAFHFTGDSNSGPFYPDQTQLTMVYSGSDPAEYMITCESSWLSLTGALTGIIHEGDSVTVTVSPVPFQTLRNDTLLEASIQLENLGDPGNSTTRQVFLTVKERELLYSWPLNSHPEWEMTGQWAWGVPGGNGGGSGSPDPVSGYTGSNALGYNLAGNYENGMEYMFMVMEPFSCLSATDVQLRYRRWLGVSGGDTAEIVGSGDFGSSGWQSVWSNSSQPVYDSIWISCVHDISGFADENGTVSIVWLMGPTNSTGTECGWNIDDIEIWGSRINGGSTVVPESSIIGRVFPNPAFDAASVYCGIQSSGTLVVSIYDLSGRLVQTPFSGEVNPGMQMITLDLSNLPAGFYAVLARIGDERSTTQFLKL